MKNFRPKSHSKFENNTFIDDQNKFSRTSVGFWSPKNNTQNFNRYYRILSSNTYNPHKEKLFSLMDINDKITDSRGTSLPIQYKRFSEKDEDNKRQFGFLYRQEQNYKIALIKNFLNNMKISKCTTKKENKEKKENKNNEKEKEKDKKEKTTKTISQNQDTMIPLPKYRPPYKNFQKKFSYNAISEETKTYVDNLKKGACNILVCVRCRPLSLLEKQLSSFETIRIMENKMLVLMDPIEYNGPTTVFKNRTREQTYAFDFAFDKYSSQKFVFENSTKFLIEGVASGYNATVFAYGATGAGKTYTMLGEEGNPGIMPLTLKELFKEVDKYKEREYKIKFWYLEIYNENIRDLLKFIDKPNSFINEDNDYLDLREDPIKGITVSGITEVNVNNSSDMLKILKRGNRNRTIEATGANETSSRSHAIFQLSLEYKDRNSGIDYEIKYSKLSLVDLAGSERASATQNRGLRLIEGGNINRSL